MATPEEIHEGFHALIQRISPLGEALMIHLAECRAFMDHYIEVDPVGDHLLEAQKALESALEIVPVLDQALYDTPRDILEELPFPAHITLRMYTDRLAQEFGSTHTRLNELFDNRADG